MHLFSMRLAGSFLKRYLWIEGWKLYNLFYNLWKHLYYQKQHLASQHQTYYMSVVQSTTDRKWLIVQKSKALRLSGLLKMNSGILWFSHDSNNWLCLSFRWEEKKMSMAKFLRTTRPKPNFFWLSPMKIINFMQFKNYDEEILLV